METRINTNKYKYCYKGSGDGLEDEYVSVRALNEAVKVGVWLNRMFNLDTSSTGRIL
jgi:hypothetical protein